MGKPAEPDFPAVVERTGDILRVCYPTLGTALTASGIFNGLVGQHPSSAKATLEINRPDVVKRMGERQVWHWHMKNGESGVPFPTEIAAWEAFCDEVESRLR